MILLTVVSVKLSSVSENRSRFTCDGSPSSVHTPSRVWSRRKRGGNFKREIHVVWKGNSYFLKYYMVGRQFDNLLLT